MRGRLRVVLASGLFEGGMPVVGLAIGRHAVTAAGSHANLIAGGLLVATGLFTALRSRSHDTSDDAGAALRDAGIVRLCISSAALSIDNLILGFALGAYEISLPAAAAIIAAVSVSVSLIGLELGERIGRRARYDNELLSGGVLIAVGIAIATHLI